MKLIYEGKTKNVYELDNKTKRLFFKDDMTGTDGEFDPGANTVGLKVKDAGYYGLKMSKFLFEKLEAEGIKTHYIAADLAERTMDVQDVSFFGQGIEVICRYVATGSFIRRYGKYMEDGTSLDSFVEISLKDDERGDPFISEELLRLFGILKAGEYTKIVDATRAISHILKEELAKYNIELLDIKLEFGKNSRGEILLIDEVSGGNMRTYRNGKKLSPIELAKIITE